MGVDPSVVNWGSAFLSDTIREFMWVLIWVIRGANQHGIYVIYVGNLLGLNGHGFDMGHQSESNKHGIHPSFQMGDNGTMKATIHRWWALMLLQGPFED